MNRFHFSILLLAALLISTTTEAKSTYQSRSLMAELSVDSLRVVWKKNKVREGFAPIRYAVKVYQVVYESRWHDGSPVKASGFLYVPQGATEEGSPMMVYCHGTRFTPKKGWRLGGEEAICMGAATDGYVVLQPDYIGLGLGNKFHLYQHRKTEAWAGIDMMYAAIQLQDSLQYRFDEHIFLTGYSQGGHASMALHQELQEAHAMEFPVTASSPMSGAYDMSGVMEKVMYQPYSRPNYLTYLLRGFNEVYGLFDGEWTEVIKPEYREVIAQYFAGDISTKDMLKVIPKVPAELIQPEFVQEYANNQYHPLRAALRVNDGYNWTPEAPMQLCFCKKDEQVDFRNSRVAWREFKQNGAKLVRKRRAGFKYGHNKCGLFSAVYTKWFFDSIRKGKEKGRKGPFFKRTALTLAKLAIKN